MPPTTEPKKRPRQKYLKGMAPPRIKEIETAAENYVEVRDERMRLQDPEEENRKILMALMKKHKLKNYEFDGRVIEIDATEKITVRKKKADKSEAAA